MKNEAATCWPCSPFQRSAFRPQILRKMTFLLQNITKYCNFRHTKLKFSCPSMLHTKMICLLRQQLLQEEREVTSGFARSVTCSSPPLGSLQASPVTAHSTAQPTVPTETGTPTSPFPWGWWGLLTQSCSWSYSQNPGLTGVNGKCAINPHESVPPFTEAMKCKQPWLISNTTLIFECCRNMHLFSVLCHSNCMNLHCSFKTISRSRMIFLGSISSWKTL